MVKEYSSSKITTRGSPTLRHSKINKHTDTDTNTQAYTITSLVPDKVHKYVLTWYDKHSFRHTEENEEALSPTPFTAWSTRQGNEILLDLVK